MDATTGFVIAMGVTGFVAYCVGKSSSEEKLKTTEASLKAQAAKDLEAEQSRFRVRIQQEEARLAQEQKTAADRNKQEFDKLKASLNATIEKERNELESQRKEFRERQQRYDKIIWAFNKEFLSGRLWLADMIAEAESAKDKSLENSLRQKDRPAPTAADTVKKIREEKRSLNAKLKFLEYQLRSYEEYFPFLDDYRDAILNERIPLSREIDVMAAIQETDPVRLYLSKEEYEGLSPAEKNQLALQKWLNRSKENWEIGRLYERYVGYLHETDGWKVTYQGALEGFADFGRDLVCRKDDIIKIIQAKYWSQEKRVREKHVFQLFGTSFVIKRQNPSLRVQAMLYSTTKVSDEARDFAKELNVNIRIAPFDKSYPMIKCNINARTGEKIYHLPFDQQYDRVMIGNCPGEKYVYTTAEAEALGFRRAWRYRGQNQTSGEG
jgi:hypothetical protein